MTIISNVINIFLLVMLPVVLLEGILSFLLKRNMNQFILSVLIDISYSFFPLLELMEILLNPNTNEAFLSINTFIMLFGYVLKELLIHFFINKKDAPIDNRNIMDAVNLTEGLAPCIDSGTESESAIFTFNNNIISGILKITTEEWFNQIEVFLIYGATIIFILFFLLLLIAKCPISLFVAIFSQNVIILIKVVELLEITLV